MTENVLVSVYEVVGSALCVAVDDGQRVYDRIAAALEAGRSVTVSFLNVDGITSAFLNAAVGQLYGVFSESDIRANLRVEDITPDDLALLKRVVETAKLYFRDPDRFHRIVEEVLEEN